MLGCLTAKAKQQQTQKRLNFKILFLILLFILTPNFVFGAESSEGILTLLHNGLRGWVPTIKSACLWVFWVLVVIDITWTFGKMALSGFEFGEFAATLIKKIITIGIFLFLFNVDYWLKILFDSFSQLATNVSSINVTPNTIIANAFDIIMIILKSLNLKIAESLFKIFAGLIILVAFVLMAIDLLIAYLKFYIMQIVIFFALALGGLSRYKEIGFNPVMAAIKIGIELFMIQGLMGLCINVIQVGYSEIATKVTFELILGLLIIALIFCMITKIIPGIIEAVFNGAIGDSAGGAAGFRAVATMAGAAAATAAVGIATGSVGATRAMKAASDAHFQNTPYQAPKNTLDAIKQTGKHTMGIASVLAGATKESLKGSFSNLSDKATSKGRMNDIANRIREKMSPIDETKNVSSGTISGANKNETYHSGINS
ncbi:conjugal transfer protein TrbL [Campylobacter fetus subsp. venerealis cfvi9825]|nr:conjugal transfer protein TrbL [Campylobacter fetus subsp. venerealis cfvi9825]